MECDSAAEAAVRALIIALVTGPNLQLKSVWSAGSAAPGAVRLLAEVSAANRDHSALEDAARALSVEPAVRSVRWGIENHAAAEWIGLA